MKRYSSVRCKDCGRGLTWIEIAFGQTFDPVCGRCLKLRPEAPPAMRPIVWEARRHALDAATLERTPSVFE